VVLPPKEAPNWFCRNGVTFCKKVLRASKAVLRTYSQVVPWYSLVPDLVTTLTTPPSTEPN